MAPSAGRRGRRGPDLPTKGYARTARVNKVMHEVLADALERIADIDGRLQMLTVTGVDCEPDLRHAVVWMASIGAAESRALSRARVRLQGEVAQQMRLKHTPQLRFEVDPAITAGDRVEGILKSISHEGHEHPTEPQA